jgi:DNA-binding NtrC family response regulator
VRGFSSDAILALYNYDWPGNVRELINRVRRAVVMSEGEFITAKDLELLRFSNVRPASLAETREIAERDAIEFALQRQGGNLDAAADDLGISKTALSKMIRSLNIDPSILKFM